MAGRLECFFNVSSKSDLVATLRLSTSARKPLFYIIAETHICSVLAREASHSERDL